jgi:hypothetical protein
MPTLRIAPDSDPSLLAAQAGAYEVHASGAGHVAARPRGHPAPAVDARAPRPPAQPNVPSIEASSTGNDISRRRPGFLASPTFLLGAVGMVGGAAALGALAYRVAHPLGDVALIAALGGVAGGAAGASLPALARAIKWSAIAAVILAVGAAALWAIHQVDPLLRLQLFPRG